VDTIKEAWDKSKAVYFMFFGCLPVCLNEEAGASDISAREFQDKLHKLFRSQDLVEAVYKESESATIMKETVAEGISLRAPLRKGREIIRLGLPIRIELKYPIEKLEADYFNTHRIKREIKASLFYDGFVYMLAFKEEKGGTLNFRRHADQIQKWMANLINGEKDIRVANVSRSPVFGTIRMYLLKEITEEKFAFPTPLEQVSKQILHFAYDASGESVQEAIRTALLLLIIDVGDKLAEFYLCRILYDEIVRETNGAREVIGRVTQELLSFYDISIVNVFRRLKKSQEIGKDLALLYALMPQIEQLGNEYESHKSQLKDDGLDETVNALCEMLNSNLSLGKETVFTQSIREMLQQDVSEIRAQVNYQLLFISALGTLLVIIIAAVTNL